MKNYYVYTIGPFLDRNLKREKEKKKNVWPAGPAPGRDEAGPFGQPPDPPALADRPGPG